MYLAQHDANKRTFILVDDAGMWIRCSAIGHIATARALANDNEVVLYYGTGRGKMGSMEGIVHIMKDSLVVQIGYKTGGKAKRSEISIEK